MDGYIPAELTRGGEKKVYRLGFLSARLLMENGDFPVMVPFFTTQPPAILFVADLSLSSQQ